MADGSRLLFVEDELEFPFETDPFFSALVEAGYEVTVATTGDQAFGLLRKTVFDCLILDIMLPVDPTGELGGDPFETGFRILNLLSEDKFSSNVGIPVVVVSSVADHTDLDVLHQIADSSGYHLAYLRKPFFPDRLVEAVDQILQNKLLTKQ